MQQNNSPRKFYNVGLSYKKADVQTRGKFSISKENQVLLLQEAKAQGIDGIFVLSTCNRTEITGFADHPFQLIKLLCQYSHGTVDEFVQFSSVHKGPEAIEHVFKLATGLSSQILGDYEIVGQLKQSFKVAKEQGTVNSYLERLINLVIQASKRVKNKTKLSSGTTSVSYAAIQYIIENIQAADTKNILVYGLGKMGKYTCKNLSEYTNNQNVCLVNRTEAKAIAFADEHQGIRYAPFNTLTDEIAKTDVLIVSTGASEPTITFKNVAEGKELLILDLSMPKNVSEELNNRKEITLVDVDELSAITDKTLEIRKNEIPKAELIIDIYKDEFTEWLNHRRFTPAVTALKESLEVIQLNEIDFHRKKIKDFDVEQAEIITSRFIQKITTKFVKHLKDENTQHVQSIEVMQKVFSLKSEKS
ncbi:MAG: glutamyl-tRNA reductase [Bacteroidetes bacterium MedPE-SWsnd-G1]|nr:MAG: glutamyl-tRNA reductase [Bacteroidetes bacterium MedPE-SWsnd-G1]